MGPSQVIIAWCRGRKPRGAWRANGTQMGHLCSGVQQTTENPTLPRVSGLPKAEPPLPAAGEASAPETTLLCCFSPGSVSSGVATFLPLGKLLELGASAGAGLCPSALRAPGSWTPHGEGREAPLRSLSPPRPVLSQDGLPFLQHPQRAACVVWGLREGAEPHVRGGARKAGFAQTRHLLPVQPRQVT